MERKAQLDFLRGIFLVIITVNHFLVFNSIIRFFTNEFVGWVTAAEGFVFLSGLTAGLVYTHKFSNKNEQIVVAASRKRAWMIYRNHVLLFLLVAIVTISGFGNNFWMEDYAAFSQKPILSIISGIFLIHQPKFMDILPMYFVFMLFVPAIIKLFHRGYTQYLLVGSMALYVVGFLNSYYNYTAQVFQNFAFETGQFNLLCWQLLFFVGLLLGYLYHNGKTQKWQVNRQLFLFAMVVGASLFAVKLLLVRVTGPAVIVHQLTLKTHLGPLRLLNFAALATIITYAASKWASRFYFKPINYLGRHSLEVFSFHILLILLFAPLKAYLSKLWVLKITNSLYLYPFGAMLIVLFIVPALFLAPIILSKKPYAFIRSRAFAQ